MTDRDRSGDGPASDPVGESAKERSDGPESDGDDGPASDGVDGQGSDATGTVDRADPAGEAIPFEETLRPRYFIRLFGSDQLRYRVDERGLAVAYEDVGADPTSALAIPAAEIRGASVVWDRESGYHPRENPRRTLALVRWAYYWMPYADPIDALVEVRTDDGPELFGTARPAAFQAAVGTVLGSNGPDDGGASDDDPDPVDGDPDVSDGRGTGDGKGRVGESAGSSGAR